MIYSFDVYDTVITRTFARPPDLFYVLVRRVLAGAGRPEPAAEVLEEMVTWRLNLERAARAAARAAGRQDTTFSDIYAGAGGNPWGLEPAEMMAAELQLEREATRPVPGMRARLDEIRRRGGRIVFVSDMYLPGTVIRGLLAAHGLAQPGDGIYVSGDVGLTKSSGELFRHVLAAEGVGPGEMLHVGDNAHSDIAMARKLGIRVEHVREATLGACEGLFAAAGADHCQARSRLAGAGRLARLSLLAAGEDSNLAEVASGVAAPVLVAYVAWVLQVAREEGRTALHFVSRDGQVLWRIARKLAGPGDPVPRYLHGSRQAWFLAALAGVTPRELDWLVVPGHCRRPRSLLAKLGLTPEEVAPLLDGRRPAPDWWNRPLLPGAEAEAEFLGLLSEPALAARIEEKAAQARRLAREYLTAQGLDAPGAALVDVGWTQKTQRAVNRILFPGEAPRLPGYYFGASLGRVGPAAAGPYRAFLVERDRYLDPGQNLNHVFRNANLVEQVFTRADHGRVLGYAEGPEGVTPVLAEPDADPAGARLSAAIGRAAEDMAAELAGIAEDPAAVDDLRQAALAVLQAFLARPEPRLARVVADVPVSDDQNETRARPLARPLGLFDLARILSGRCRFEDSCDWLEGAIALSPAWLKPVLRRRAVFERLRAWRKSL